MNQKKLVTEIFLKYADFPGITTDLKKILKYTESANRFFINSIINEEPETMSITPEVKAVSLNIIETVLGCVNTLTPDINESTLTDTLTAALAGRSTAERRYLLDSVSLTLEKIKELAARVGKHV